MQILLLRLFGHKPQTTVLRPTTKFRTMLPPEKLSFHQWCKEFNVGRLWDRKVIDMN